ncbi:MAG: hypothetical protein EOO38_27200, partial [Cytophagaceae bacterium]
MRASDSPLRPAEEMQSSVSSLVAEMAASAIRAKEALEHPYFKDIEEIKYSASEYNYQSHFPLLHELPMNLASKLTNHKSYFHLNSLKVFEKDLFKVRNGQKVTFTLTNQDNREITGRVYGVNKSFENESKGIVVHA